METDRVKVGKRREEEDSVGVDRRGPCGWMQGRTTAWAGSAVVPFPHIPHLYGNGGTTPPTTLLWVKEGRGGGVEGGKNMCSKGIEYMD